MPTTFTIGHERLLPPEPVCELGTPADIRPLFHEGRRVIADALRERRADLAVVDL